MTAPLTPILAALAFAGGSILATAAGATPGASDSLNADITVTIPSAPSGQPDQSTGPSTSPKPPSTSTKPSPSNQPGGSGLAKTGVSEFALVGILGSGIALAAGGVLLVRQRRAKEQ